MRLPSTLRLIGASAFSRCAALGAVALPEGLLEVGEACFCGSVVSRVLLPTSLESVGARAFESISGVRRVFAGRGCALDVRGLFGDDVEMVRFPSLGTRVRGATLGALRGVRSLVLPAGLRRVGARWFFGASLEEVRFPTSVRAVEEEAFLCCARLGSVSFAPGSRLRRLGRACFRECGLREFDAPGRLRFVEREAFCGCRGLEEFWIRLVPWLRVESLAFAGTKLRRHDVRFPIFAQVARDSFSED